MSDTTPLSPRQALFGSEAATPCLPVCDHYAGVPERMRKALALQAEWGERNGRALFDVTLDLEDGAAVGGEAEHRALVCELLRSADNRFGRIGVRVHDLTHPHFDADVDELVRHAGERLAFVMVPKLADVAAARQAIAAVQGACGRHGLSRTIPVHGLIESPRAVQEVGTIASLPGLESLSFGLMDFVSEHRGAIPASAMTAAGQFSHPMVLRAKLEISAACHAAGIVPSHCVVTEFKDVRAVTRAAEQAAGQLGYTRMWSIHPDQIDPILEAFSPVTSDVDEAVEILERAQTAQWAPISYLGRLHDRASYRHYWHVLQRAWLTGQPLAPDLVNHYFQA